MTPIRQVRFVPDLSRMAQVRRQVRKAAAEIGVDASARDTLALIVDELVTNAIEHGRDYRKGDHELSVQIRAGEGALMLEFFDPEMPDSEVRELASALSEAASGMPELNSERGRGLFLVSVYTEELRVAVAEGGGLHLYGRIAVA